MKFARNEMIILASTLLFLLIPISAAQVLISQPESLYNFGDEFELSITIKPQAYASGYLVATLICPAGEVELFSSPISVNPDKEKEIELSMNLDNFLVSGMEGQCHVKAEFMDDSFATPKFELSKKIVVTMSLNGPVYNPGDTVLINGEARKENEEPLIGFVEVIIPGIGFTHTSTVNGGTFNFSFKIPDDAPAGSYKIDVQAYEQDAFGEIINEGFATNVIRINQVIKEIEIAFEKQTLVPTEDLSYTIYLYDQSQEQASKDIAVEIFNPDETLHQKLIVRSGEAQLFDLEPNFAPGYWKINAKYEELLTQRTFLIEEYKDLSFVLENETLSIENTGNVPYTGPVEIVIGDTNEIREIENLALGSVKKFKLKAPNGEYNIGVGKGTQRSDLGTTFLTGNAVSVDDVNDSLGGNLYILLGLVLVLILAIAFVLVYRKYRKGSLLLKPSKEKSSEKAIEQKAIEKGAAATLIDKGEKQETSILVLNLKNIADLKANPDAIKSIDSALWKAKESGAKIYTDESFRIAIFAPVLTKEKDNTLRAASVAQSAERILQAYNKRAQVKINYGMAIHHGTLIVENKEGNFRFMSLTNIIGGTKKIAAQANSEILVTEVFHNKTVGKIKKTKLKDKKLWKIERVVDRSEHSEYIRNLSLKKKVDDNTKKK